MNLYNRRIAGSRALTQAFVRAAPAPQLPPPETAGRRMCGVVAQSLRFAEIARAHARRCGACHLGRARSACAILVFGAVWHGDAATCRATDGACWPFIAEKLPYFVYGSYPLDQRWRVDLVFAHRRYLRSLAAVAADAAHGGSACGSPFVVYPIFAFVLLYGWPALGLPRVASDLWGGMLVTLLVSAVGIVFSLPLGILLALGRRSELPAVRLVSIAFIEFVRGVPLIAVLVHGQLMLPLFLPEGVEPDRLVRPLVGVALFASAYMAEVVRGGLQAIAERPERGGRGARPAASWQIQRLVVLPQALRLVIPAIVNTSSASSRIRRSSPPSAFSISCGRSDLARLDPNWAGPTITPTGYAFAALVYFVFCFGHVALCAGRWSGGLRRATSAEIRRLMIAEPKHFSHPAQARYSCNTLAVEIEHLNKWYGDFHVLRDIDLTVAQRRAHRDLRPVRLRQIDADPLHQRARGISSRAGSPSTAWN